MRVNCVPEPETVKVPMVKLHGPEGRPTLIDTACVVAGGHVDSVDEGAQLGSMAGPEVDPGEVGDVESPPHDTAAMRAMQIKTDRNEWPTRE